MWGYNGQRNTFFAILSTLYLEYVYTSVLRVYVKRARDDGRRFSQS